MQLLVRMLKAVIGQTHCLQRRHGMRFEERFDPRRHRIVDRKLLFAKHMVDRDNTRSFRNVFASKSLRFSDRPVEQLRRNQIRRTTKPLDPRGDDLHVLVASTVLAQLVQVVFGDAHHIGPHHEHRLETVEPVTGQSMYDFQNRKRDVEKLNVTHLTRSGQQGIGLDFEHLHNGIVLAPFDRVGHPFDFLRNLRDRQHVHHANLCPYRSMQRMLQCRLSLKELQWPRKRSSIALSYTRHGLFTGFVELNHNGSRRRFGRQHYRCGSIAGLAHIFTRAFGSHNWLQIRLMVATRHERLPKGHRYKLLKHLDYIQYRTMSNRTLPS